MERPLTNHDIDTLLGDKVLMIEYKNLASVESIDPLVEHYGALCVLYPGTEGDEAGHWTAVIKTVDDRGRNILEHYDPYGISVDKEFGYVPRQHRFPHILSYLLSKSKYPVYASDSPQQRMQVGNATCGRHVVSRIWNRHMPYHQYISEVRAEGGGDMDRAVFRMTEPFLQQQQGRGSSSRPSSAPRTTSGGPLLRTCWE